MHQQLSNNRFIGLKRGVLSTHMVVVNLKQVVNKNILQSEVTNYQLECDSSSPFPFMSYQYCGFGDW